MDIIEPVDVDNKEIKIVPTVIEFVVVVEYGVDEFNLDHDKTLIQFKILDDTQLYKVHYKIVERLAINNQNSFTYYKLNHENIMESLNIFKTLKELSINYGDSIVLKYKSHHEKRKKAKSFSENEQLIELSCVTRIDSENTNQDIRKIKVLVQRHHYCHDFIQELSNYLGRSRLKFKCGRTVLKADKTFEDQGVENGVEIVITGGR